MGNTHNYTHLIVTQIEQNREDAEVEEEESFGDKNLNTTTE